MQTSNIKFTPSQAFSQNAHIKSEQEYQQLYNWAAVDPEGFWAYLAGKELHWFEKWDKVLDWQPPFAQWFVNGKINISYNCLDRHLATWRKNKAAIIWQGEPGESRTLTYAQLHQEVCQFANALKQLGIQKGDLVGIYLPMIPEAIVAMLACARIGAPHSVVFSGFSPESLKERLNDAKAKLVITADGSYRKDKLIPLKEKVDVALANNTVPTVEKVIVIQHTKHDIGMRPRRDYWWHDLQKTVSADCPAEAMDSEDPLFILYTSGSTGKPKGVVHTTGGYNLYTHITAKWVFDLKDTDIYWCTADIGWITGHSYIVYGPLSNGATIFMYEGAVRPSNPGCLWEAIEKYGVTIFYTAPTLIRTLREMGEDIPQKYDLSSLRLLGSVGEPIDPEVWMWYHRVIGGERCPIVDTWWQTETGGIMIAPLPGVTPTKPGSATRPFPGIIADIVDYEGDPALVIKQPWPGMMRTVYNDPERYRKSYWEAIPPKEGQYFYLSGDGVRQDEDGYFWILGRLDDVINSSGHRLSNAQIESTLVFESSVAEAAVVGIPHTIKGESVFAFVILKKPNRPTQALYDKLKQHVKQEIGAIACPDEICFVEALPNNCSGKIMRRLLRSLAVGQEITQDISTLADPTVIGQLRQGVEKMRAGY